MISKGTRGRHVCSEGGRVTRMPANHLQRLRRGLVRFGLVSSVGAGLGLLACLISGNFSHHLVLVGLLAAWVLWLIWRHFRAWYLCPWTPWI